MKPKRIYLNRVEGDDSNKIWSEEPVSVCDYVQNGEYINLSQVWHDASEEPKFGEDVIAIDIDGVSVAGVYKDYNGKGIYRYHCFLCEWDAVDKWAYVSDLLPKGGDV